MRWMNKLLNILFMFFIILAIIVCAYSLFSAITIFSDNQYKLTESTDELYRILEEKINSLTGTAQQTTNNNSSTTIDNVELILKNIERATSFYKQTSNNDILSFLYIFITTVFVGVGAYILRQLSSKFSDLNITISEQNKSLEKSKNELTLQNDFINKNQERLSIQDKQINILKSEIDNQLDEIKENQIKLSSTSKKILNEHTIDLKRRHEINQIDFYINSSQNSIFMLEILFHTGKANLDIVSSPYIPMLRDNIRNLFNIFTVYDNIEGVSFRKEDLLFVSSSIAKIIEMIKLLIDESKLKNREIKPLNRILNECKKIYEMAIRISQKLI